jgi:hypothetical protein
MEALLSLGALAVILGEEICIQLQPLLAPVLTLPISAQLTQVLNQGQH